MARIPLTSGFTNIPEGEHVLRIYDVAYDEIWGKIEVSMINAQGLTMVERFTLKDANDEPNEKAMAAFSYFAKTAINNYEATEIDPMDMINHYIRATVVHNQLPSRTKPGKMVTFVNLGDKKPADGFDTTPTDAALNKGRAVPKAAPTTDAIGLYALLG